MDNAHKILSFNSAVHCLEQGGLIIYPTETFFAVGCKVHAHDTLERLYNAKNRPKLRPIPVLAANMEQVESVAILNAYEIKLAEQFWPAPLTLITKARDDVPRLVSAGTANIAVRISAHPVARGLAEAVGGVLVSSSANISGEDAVTCYEQLSKDLINCVDGVVLDAPKPQGELASTLVQVVGDGELIIRRYGAVSEQELQSKGWVVRV